MAQGLADIDIRADLQPLGSALFTLLTGKPPLSGLMPWMAVNAVCCRRFRSRSQASVTSAVSSPSKSRMEPGAVIVRNDPRSLSGLPLSPCHQNAIAEW